MTRVIGITGGIGAGKSVVARILRLKGFRVYDCDMEAKRLMEQSDKLRRCLTEILGEEAYNDGLLDRGFVASRIFAIDELRRQVNSVVHKAVAEDFKKAVSCGGTIVFVESAILSTSGMDCDCNEIWVVDAPEEIRIERVIARNGLQREAILERMETQREEFSGLPKDKTSVIVNDGVTPLLPAIGRLLGEEDRGAIYQINIKN